jgi:dihydrolipoamide dehydrogenase
VPSKALLAAAEAGDSWSEAVDLRNDVTNSRDDSRHEKSLQRKGVEVVRGHGVVTGPGRLAVGDRELQWRDLIVATGAEPVIPPIGGIDDAPVWTSEDALTNDELPGTLLVLGGGPIGCELAQAYARLGSEVVLIEVADRLLAREPAFVGEQLVESLRLDGVEVLLGTNVERVERTDDGVAVMLDDGDVVSGERLLVASGKKPRVEGIGLDTLDVTIRDGVLVVDDRGNAGPHVWAAGDVTAVSPYTHAANFQARAVVANILGEQRSFDTHAIPRCVYTDPAVMCVGRTDGVDVLTATSDVGETARAAVAGHLPGKLELYADPARGALVGAAVIAADADAWGTELVLAIQAGVPVSTLVDVVHAFPTYGEALEPAYHDLLDQMRGADA